MIDSAQLILSLLIVVVLASCENPGAHIGKEKARAETEAAPGARETPREQRRAKVYVASPLGFAKSTKSFMNNELIPVIKRAGFTPLNPWDLESELSKKLKAKM